MVCIQNLDWTHCNSLQFTAIHFNLMQTYYRTLQHTATHCNSLHIKSGCTAIVQNLNRAHCNSLQPSATHCNPLQHAATHCNTLQLAATRCNSLQLAAHCVRVYGISPKSGPESGGTMVTVNGQYFSNYCNDKYCNALHCHFFFPKVHGWVMSNTDESCHIYKRSMSHMNASYYTFEWVTRICMNAPHDASEYVSCITQHRCVMYCDCAFRVLQQCTARMYCNNVLQQCTATMYCNNVLQQCTATMYCNNVLQQYTATCAALCHAALKIDYTVTLLFHMHKWIHIYLRICIYMYIYVYISTYTYVHI